MPEEEEEEQGARIRGSRLLAAAGCLRRVAVEVQGASRCRRGEEVRRTNINLTAQ